MFKDKKIDRLYHTWKSILNRTCDNYKNDRHYKTYKEKNIKICDEWLVWENFKKWALENGYDYIPYPSGRNKITIDRIDNNGNYEPSNCKWVTHEENQYNKDNTIYIEYKGKKYNIKELSEITGLPKTTIRARYLRDISYEKQYKQKRKYIYEYNSNIVSLDELSKITSLPKTTLSARAKRESSFDKPYKEKKEYYFDYNGKKYSLTELSKISGIKRYTLYKRVFKYNWTIEEAMNRQVMNCKKDIKLYEYNGNYYNITDLAKILGIGRTTLQYRIKNNLDYYGKKKGI